MSVRQKLRALREEQAKRNEEEEPIELQNNLGSLRMNAMRTVTKLLTLSLRDNPVEGYRQSLGLHLSNSINIQNELMKFANANLKSFSNSDHYAPRLIWKLSVELYSICYRKTDDPVKDAIKLGRLMMTIHSDNPKLRDVQVRLGIVDELPSLRYMMSEHQRFAPFVPTDTIEQSLLHSIMSTTIPLLTAQKDLPEDVRSLMRNRTVEQLNKLTCGIFKSFSANVVGSQRQYLLKSSVTQAGSLLRAVQQSVRNELTDTQALNDYMSITTLNSIVDQTLETVVADYQSCTDLMADAMQASKQSIQAISVQSDSFIEGRLADVLNAINATLPALKLSANSSSANMIAKQYLTTLKRNQQLVNYQLGKCRKHLKTLPTTDKLIHDLWDVSMSIQSDLARSEVSVDVGKINENFDFCLLSVLDHKPDFSQLAKFGVTENSFQRMQNVREYLSLMLSGQKKNPTIDHAVLFSTFAMTGHVNRFNWGLNRGLCAEKLATILLWNSKQMYQTIQQTARPGVQASKLSLFDSCLVHQSRLLQPIWRDETDYSLSVQPHTMLSDYQIDPRTAKQILTFIKDSLQYDNELLTSMAMKNCNLLAKTLGDNELRLHVIARSTDVSMTPSPSQPISVNAL